MASAEAVQPDIDQRYPRPSKAAAPKSSAYVGIRLSFDGANSNATVAGADQLPGIANFFIGNDPSQWRTNVTTYAGVVYHDLYPGVDLNYSGQPGLLKGTYTLAAGVDPSLIRWRYEGAEQVSLNLASGDLTINLPEGIVLAEKAPIAWQMRDDGTRVPVTVGYRVNVDESIQFAPKNYDVSLPLTIDPSLDYSTYLGGSGSDQGKGIAVDGTGNVYITGNVNGGFPTTSGAFQTAPGSSNSTCQVSFKNDCNDAFVSKLSASGSTLLYSTYLGGNQGDDGNGIVVDSGGDAYVTGSTLSSNFPITSGASQTTKGGDQCQSFGVVWPCADAFVTKLNSAGNALVYSTYLGGSLDDYAWAIAIDGTGNAYVTGWTLSTDFPTTSGAFQTTCGTSCSLFVTKLNSTGSARSYSTYLGSGNGVGTGIAVDVTGNAYVTGETNGGLPTTSGAFQTSFGGGGWDAFVTKLNSTGSTLTYSTYLGGSQDDYGYGIAVDSNGNAYVTGETNSSNFPTTSGAFQTTYSGAQNTAAAFVSKLNAAGNGPVYSTFLGGIIFDYGDAIVTVDGGNNTFNVVVTGHTYGSFPITPDAFQTGFGGGQANAFVTELNATGSVLVYSTYLGCRGNDQGFGIAYLNSDDTVYVVGSTSSVDFPNTPGVYQKTLNGSQNAFVSKFTLR